MSTTPRSAHTGIQQLRAAASSNSGIGKLLGMRVEQIEVGTVSFSLDPRPDFANPMGTVHGGVLATLLDTVVSCAVHSALTDGAGYATVSLTTNYVRSVGTDAGTITGEGRVVHLGRRIATAEGTVMSSDGSLLVHGSATCLIIQPRHDSESANAEKAG